MFDLSRLAQVAEIANLSHSYGNNKLFDNVDLFISKGDRIAVVGPNGAGKSTLLRFLMGKEQPDGGSASIVGQNVVANFFEQNQADVLDLDLTVSETIQKESNGQSYNELRALLGQFLFKGDAVDKKVGALSGGEKARLSLCCMMLRPANFLILGEIHVVLIVDNHYSSSCPIYFLFVDSCLLTSLYFFSFFTLTFP